MTSHATELRRHSRKLGSPSGDTPSVMTAAAAHIDAQAAEIQRLKTALNAVDRQLGHDDEDDALRAEIAQILGEVE